MADIDYRRIDVRFVQQRTFEIKKSRQERLLPEQHKQEGSDQHSQPEQR
jgi:hypothetical protein